MLHGWSGRIQLNASSGENLGWIQKMMGHSSLKMITDKYFAYIPNMTHNDGSKFLAEYNKKTGKFTPVLHQEPIFGSKLLKSLVEAGGVEPLDHLVISES